jgi:hypothetical protein
MEDRSLTRLDEMLRWMVFGERVRRSPRRRALYRGPNRDDDYKAFIRRQQCCACGRTPTEAAHTGRDGGMSQKSSDYSCVPLCHGCHTVGGGSCHRIGRKEFELLHGIDFEVVVEGLFTEWSGSSMAEMKRPKTAFFFNRTRPL